MYAYYAQRSPERAALGRQMFREAVSARSAKRAASYWVRRFGVLVIVIAVILGLFNVLGLSTEAKIVPLDNVNTAGYLHSTATYQQYAQSQLAGSILNRNKITLDANAVAAAIRREFPELAVVSVSFTLGGHRPIVYIEATRPALVLVTPSGHSYVIDENGRAVSDTSGTMAEALHLVNVTDASGQEVQPGSPVLSTDTVAFIQEVTYQMQQKRVGISTFSLPAGTSELDMYLSGQTYFVKFNLADDSADQQIGTFLAVRHTLQGQGKVPSKYIDVRVLGRAYYK